MNGSVLRREIFRQFLRPLSWISAAVFILTINLLFFITSGFFIEGQGSSEIRTLFSLIPYISIIVIPALTMDFTSINEEEGSLLPVNNLKLSVSKWASAFIIFLFMIALLIPSILVVGAFGDVNVPQVVSCYAGIMLYGAAAISLSSFLAELFESRISAFFVSAGVLFLCTVSDLLPLAIHLPGFLTDFLNEISFSWHFDSSSKGIFDTRDIFFYLILTALFIILSSEHAEFLKKQQKPFIPLLWCLAALVFLVNTTLYSTRFDITEDRQFSVSEASAETLEDLASPLEITYYLSDELERMYPQIRDVKAFLFSFARESSRIALTITDPSETATVEQQLSSLGIQAQQLQTSEANKTSFVTVYSSILIEYEGNAAVIPFIISTATLEFDLTSRIKTLLSGSQDTVYIIAGNGLSLSTEYVYVEPWLQSAGYAVSEVTADTLDDIENTGAQDVLLVLGSSTLSPNDTASIERWIMKGRPCFIATAPYTADISSSWNVTPVKKDYLVELLDYWGVGINQSLLLDLSNYRLRMYSSQDTNQSLYLNYPFWIVCLPQYTNPSHPVTERFTAFETYWASPLTLYEDEGSNLPVITPLILTSPSAWLQKPDTSKDLPYVTDPFISENLAPDESTKGQYVLMASIEGSVSGFYSTGKSSPVRIIVSGDQYFPSTVIENTNSPENLDLLVNALLWLSGKDTILSLKNKGMMNATLYKISDSLDFAKAAGVSKLILFLFEPLFIALCAVCFCIIRKKSSERRIKAILTTDMEEMQ
ncbi:MAG: Gldg family protein [Treponema sp.]|nr:Gldg family protein [Candidatus Treponema caballi]